MGTSHKSAVSISRLLSGLGGSTTNPLASVSLPQPVNADCEIRDYKVLGSYNWLDSKTPTIVIPGQPRIWQEPNLPLRLSPDRGHNFIDQNAWRCQESPLEPLFRSISVTQKLLGNNSISLSEQQIDVVTDRNNLRKLNAMIESMRSKQTLASNKHRQFRIDTRLAPNGRTLLLTRYSDQRQRTRSSSDTGYGNNFEHATTSEYTPIIISNHGQSGQKKFTPTSYHRIAKYSLADLNLLVRYEVDAIQQSPIIISPIEQDLEVTSPPKFSTLHHIVSGTLVPQDRVIELKTNKKWTRIIPQLYFSQTPILKVGIHRNGNFSTVEDYLIEKSYDARVMESHQALIDNLRFLVPILKRMREACQQHGRSGKPLAFFWSGAGSLQLYDIKHPKPSHILPEDILESL